MEILGLPLDRSLTRRDSGWHAVELESASASGKVVAAACLIVFARIHRWGHFRVALDLGWVAALLGPETTLEELLGSLTDDGAQTAEVAQLDLRIAAAAPLPSATGDASGPSMMLGCAARGPRMSMTLQARREIISELSARDLLEKIARVLDAVTQQPTARLMNVSLLTSVSLGVGHDPAKPIRAAAHRLAHEAFLDAARRCAGEPAIRHRHRSYSYDELRRMSLHLAERLSSAGVGVGDIVTVTGRSSFGLIAGALAILMVGGVLVPIDETLPTDRQRQIANLTEARHRISVLTDPTRPADDRDATLVVPAWPDRGELDAIRESAWQAPPVPQDADAYVFFTSGSTGAPKGVRGVHRGLAHFLDWQRSNFTIGAGDRSAQLTALSFDVVLRDIFFPLTSGATICIPDRELVLDARRMLAWFRDNGITVLHCVPSLMKAWLQADEGARSFASLTYIFFAGEPLTDGLLTRFRAAASASTRIVNLYGPTETTLAKLANPIDSPEPGVQPVGRPQPGVDVFIVRERRVFCGLWETGEIAIRTPYRSHGYFRNEALTGQVFLVNPARADPQDLIYYTGDLGRLRADGKVEIFGRIDSQIKIRGVRIEPNEIETLMLKLPGIRDAAVTVRAGANEDKILYGVVARDLAKDGGEARDFEQRIRGCLRAQLHEAMVPARVVFVDQLPYLPNGKLNRKALAALDVNDAVPTADAAQLELSPAARRIFEPLRRLIPAPLRMDRSFIELGGDSLSFIEATLIIERVLGRVPEGWERLPLQRLATVDDIGPGSGSGSGGAHADEAGGGAGRAAAAPFPRIEIGILIRAITILLVVLGHADASLTVTATSTLFVVSGISFGRFLAPALADAGDLRPTLRFIAKLGIPAGLWELTRALWMHHLWIPDLLLAGTMFQDPQAPHFTLWYLDILAASVLLLSAALKIKHALGARAQAVARTSTFAWEIAVIALGLAASAAQVKAGIWDGVLGEHSVGPFRWFWMFALGALCAEADTAGRKSVVAGVLAVVTLMSYGMHAVTDLNSFFYASVLLLLFVPRVPVPRLLLHPLILIASSTLFIYIFNYSVIYHLMPRLGLPAWLPLQVTLAVLTGILLSRVWDRLGLLVKKTWAMARHRGESLPT